MWEDRTNDGQRRSLRFDPKVTRTGRTFSQPAQSPGAVTGAALQVPSSRHLHLREAAIREQFHSRDIAAVVGGEKYDSLRNLV
jgi:hypothetical protein